MIWGNPAVPGFRNPHRLCFGLMIPIRGALFFTRIRAENDLSLLRDYIM